MAAATRALRVIRAARVLRAALTRRTIGFMEDLLDGVARRPILHILRAHRNG
jgi:hypothetical protein